MSDKPRFVKLVELEPELQELTAQQAEAVQGGRSTRRPKLAEAACKGKVFTRVEIHSTT